MILLDTHCWIWWLTTPRALSKKAHSAIREAMVNYQVCISSISVWEIAMLVQRGRLQLAIDYREFIRQTEKLAFVQFIEPNNTILVNSVELSGYSAKDPADRIIVATANHMGAMLVTKDESIRAYRQVRSLW